MLARVPRAPKPKFRLGSRYRNSASDYAQQIDILKAGLLGLDALAAGLFIYDNPTFPKDIGQILTDRP